MATLATHPPQSDPCPHRHGDRCDLAAKLFFAHAPCDDQTCAVCTTEPTPRATNRVTVSLAAAGAMLAGDGDAFRQLIVTHNHLLHEVDDPRWKLVTESNGVGSQLWRLLESIGVRHTPSCPCLDWALRLNAWGPVGCRVARAEIVERLKTAREEYGWQRSILAAARAVWTMGWRLNPLDPYGSLVDEAIRRAEQADRDLSTLQTPPQE